ncbi:uncharacterized protein LOC125832805 [Solanum verrucosum]|uniref:uncharacterized protein LOC125832805 n=1 Tax=Solanum verrucosum TaxID=315347 RepID=UPI0020D0D63C|nr:uncharacterized protein LOC125832805 [Solanum verrucosum]
MEMLQEHMNGTHGVFRVDEGSSSSYSRSGENQGLNFRRYEEGFYPRYQLRGGNQGNASSPWVNNLLSRIFDKVEGSDDLLKGMKDDFISLNSKVNSHADAIKMLEGKLSLLSTQLPSKTPMNYNERKLVMVTRSGKVAIGNVMENEDPQNMKRAKEEAEQQIQVPKVIHPLPKIPPPFPQRLKKKNEDEKFKNFLSVFKSFSINLPLVEALLEMPGYAKFMKELVTNERSLDYETIEVPHSCSAIMTNDSITKRKDPGAFTIPCTIGMLQFAKALCNLGASINLIPYVIYKQLGLGEPKATTMRLLMADRSIKHQVDCEIDVKIPIILGRPFLATGRALVDVESGKLKFRVNDDEVTFNICKSMKQPSNIHVVSTEDVIDEAVASVCHLMHKKEPLESVLANYDEFKVLDYGEIVAALSRLGAYSRNPIKLDIDQKNRESPPAKPSTEEPLNLELKALPSHPKYVFLGANNTLPVIIAADLLERQVKLLIEVLRKHIKAIGWTI